MKTRQNIKLTADIRVLWGMTLHNLGKELVKKVAKHIKVTTINGLPNFKESQIRLTPRGFTPAEEIKQRTVIISFEHHREDKKAFLMKVFLQPHHDAPERDITSQWVHPKHLLSDELATAITAFITDDNVFPLRMVPMARSLQ